MTINEHNEENVNANLDIPNEDSDKVTKNEKTSSEEVQQHLDTTDSTENQTDKFTNAIQTDEFSSDSSKPTDYTISLPSINLADFTDKLKQFNKLDLEDKESSLKEWSEVNKEATNFYTVGGLYQDRFTDETSKFYQGIKNQAGELNTISTPKFRKTEGELKGEAAILKVSKMLGLGDVINVPLPHSGIWVTLKPPTEKDLIDFYNSIFREKIMLGRATFGLTLTNFSVHINNRLFDFIIKHIHSLNYNDINKEELKNYLLIHDFPILAWGFACTMYPNGFEYQRSCVNDIEKCSYIAKAKLNLTKLLWIDNLSLTDAQRLILEEFRPNKLTIENYRKFINEHTRVIGSSFTTKNGIKFKLRVPTFSEYITDGLAWINGVNSNIENIILRESEQDKEDDEKIEMLNQYVKTSILRQFNHFIDYIELEDNVITDRDTINKVLEVFSSDDDIRTEITENVLKFKSKTTIGIIGIPEYNCPKCGKPQNTSPVNEKFVSVIPLDTMNLFFTLLTLRISRILEREV